jgi:hypothetical protein
MWICLNNAFFSIIEDVDNPKNLLVRARDENSIENVFRDVTVKKTPHRDYLYRTSIRREVVAEKIKESLMNINYDNFKDSVDDKELHDAYARFWYVMYDYQHKLNR